MKAPLSFHSFIGNHRVVEILRRAVAQDRLPHALIFAGPDGLGKRTLGLRLAQQLNCLQAANGEACNDCISCRMYAWYSPMAHISRSTRCAI